MINSNFAVAEPAASPARGSCRAIRILAIAVGGLLMFAAVAQAQGIIDRPERADRYATRDGDGKTSEKSEDKDFTIGIDLALRRSSSVTSGSRDSVLEDRPDSHVTPDVYVKWSHQYSGWKASAEVGATMDRYFKTPDANLDGLHSAFKLAKTDGKFEYFVPYASFNTEMFFLPTFKTPDITYNDFAVGFYSGVAWRDKQRIPYIDSLIPYSDAGDPGDVSVHFDAKFGRRMSDTTNYQNTFASAKLSGTYYISSDWRVETNAGIRGRWYEDYNGEKRTDWRPSAAIGLVWTPDWLKKIVKRSELSLNLEYYRNYSNIIDKNYQIWEVGPTLSLRTKF